MTIVYIACAVYIWKALFSDPYPETTERLKEIL